jgi:hypothetical protein
MILVITKSRSLISRHTLSYLYSYSVYPITILLSNVNTVMLTKFNTAVRTGLGDIWYPRGDNDLNPIRKEVTMSKLSMIVTEC